MDSCTSLDSPWARIKRAHHCSSWVGWGMVEVGLVWFSALARYYSGSIYIKSLNSFPTCLTPKLSLLFDQIVYNLCLGVWINPTPKEIYSRSERLTWCCVNHISCHRVTILLDLEALRISFRARATYASLPWFTLSQVGWG